MQVLEGILTYSLLDSMSPSVAQRFSRLTSIREVVIYHRKETIQYRNRFYRTRRVMCEWKIVIKGN